MVGLPGSGKTEVSEYLRSRKDFRFLRFGQLTLDRIIEMGKEPSEALEKEVREQIRREHGMGAYATLNIQKIETMLEAGDTLGDGLYSWEEYIILKEKFGDKLVVIAVYAPPKLRHRRLEHRSERHGDDPKKVFRSFTKEEAKARDVAQIERLNQAGPIAMADYTITNIKDLESLHNQIDTIFKEIYA